MTALSTLPNLRSLDPVFAWQPSRAGLVRLALGAAGVVLAWQARQPLGALVELIKDREAVLRLADGLGIWGPVLLGATIALPRGTAYCATKAAVAHFTSALACEWGKFGIRVNAVAPGSVRTAMSEEVWDDPERRRFNTEQTPLGRWGRPVDVAAAVRYLVSDEASYVTGHILYVDGGRTKW